MEMTQLPEIKNYKIIRKIGEGGYGKVYLASHDGGYVALKIIQSENSGRERKALEKYSKISDRANIVNILDIGFTSDFFYYATPLADPLDGAFAKEDFRWQPKSLQNLIAARLDSPSKDWFSPEEILAIMGPIFDAAIALGENGLLHRDIKPDNILFFGGRAKLSDFGLVENDRRSVSNMGTPLYSAPSWYVAKGGNPDAYGIAATFYTLISGNLPDTLGRPAYRFPEKEIKDRDRWLHWHRCILRCVSENPSERFVTLEAFKQAVFSENFESSKSYGIGKKGGGNSRKISIAVVAVIALLGVFLAAKYAIFHRATPPEDMVAVSDELYSKIKANGFQSGVFFIEDMQTWKRQRMSVLKVCQDNFIQSKALAEKTKEQVLADVEKRIADFCKTYQLFAPNSDEFKEYREKEIEMALYAWRLARSSLADELETIRNLKDALRGENAYREYVAHEYKNYLDSLK